jgi:hypothetical protein
MFHFADLIMHSPKKRKQNKIALQTTNGEELFLDEHQDSKRAFATPTQYKQLSDEMPTKHPIPPPKYPIKSMIPASGFPRFVFWRA